MGDVARAGIRYQRSLALDGWQGSRRQSLEVLELANRHVGRIAGPGRPSDIGRPLAHAYVLQLVGDFQGFARQLHDLAAQALIASSGADGRHHAELVLAVTRGRALDRGNADLRALQQDFRRLGIDSLRQRLSTVDNRWQADRIALEQLTELRNAIAHGHTGQIAELRRRGIRDTRSWARSRRPHLARIAAALDRVVWDHLHETFEREPW